MRSSLPEPLQCVGVAQGLDVQHLAQQVGSTVDRAHADPGIGLADASLVVLAARAGTRSLLTLDERHFRALSPRQGGAFVLLPADARALG